MGWARLFQKWGANVDAVDFKGRTLLHRAVENHDNKRVRFLLELGADHSKTYTLIEGNKSWILDYTPLHVAAMVNNLEAIDILCDNGADCNFIKGEESKCDKPVKNSKGGGISPLHAAVIFDNLEAVEKLVEKGAIVRDTRGFQGHEPLDMAIWCSSSIKVVNWFFTSPLTKKLFDLNSTVYGGTRTQASALASAVYYDKPQIAKMLVDDLSADPKTAEYLLKDDSSAHKKSVQWLQERQENSATSR